MNFEGWLVAAFLGGVIVFLAVAVWYWRREASFRAADADYWRDRWSSDVEDGLVRHKMRVDPPERPADTEESETVTV